MNEATWHGPSRFGSRGSSWGFRSWQTWPGCGAGRLAVLGPRGIRGRRVRDEASGVDASGGEPLDAVGAGGEKEDAPGNIVDGDTFRGEADEALARLTLSSLSS